MWTVESSKLGVEPTLSSPGSAGSCLRSSQRSESEVLACWEDKIEVSAPSQISAWEVLPNTPAARVGDELRPGDELVEARKGTKGLGDSAAVEDSRTFNTKKGRQSAKAQKEYGVAPLAGERHGRHRAGARLWPFVPVLCWMECLASMVLTVLSWSVHMQALLTTSNHGLQQIDPAFVGVLIRCLQVCNHTHANLYSPSVRVWAWRCVGGDVILGVPHSRARARIAR